MTVTSYNNSHDNPNNPIYMTVTSYNNSHDNRNNPIYDCD